MKFLHLTLLALTLALPACKPGVSTHEKVNERLTSTDQTPQERCFAYDLNDDLIGLSITITGDHFTGKLAYAYSNDDRNTGTVEGTIRGDTLIADYTYYSGGTSGIREVIFLLRDDDSLVEASGETTERDGKLVYANRSALKFNSNIALHSIPCHKGNSIH